MNMSMPTLIAVFVVTALIFGSAGIGPQYTTEADTDIKTDASPEGSTKPKRSQGSTKPKRERVIGGSPAADAFAANKAMKIYWEEKAVRDAVPHVAPSTAQPESAPDPTGILDQPPSEQAPSPPPAVVVLQALPDSGGPQAASLLDTATAATVNATEAKLPGGYYLGDKVFYVEEPSARDRSLPVKLMYGLQGEVEGRGTLKDGEEGLAVLVLFKGNKGNVAVNPISISLQAVTKLSSAAKQNEKKIKVVNEARFEGLEGRQLTIISSAEGNYSEETVEIKSTARMGKEIILTSGLTKGYPKGSKVVLQEDFIPSDHFAGARQVEGFTFSKKGPEGVGFYNDAASHEGDQWAAWREEKAAAREQETAKLSNDVKAAAEKLAATASAKDKGAAKPAAPEATAKAKASQEDPLDNEEFHVVEPVQPEAANTEAAVARAPLEEEDFIPYDRAAGARQVVEGFTLKQGPKGNGYYKDSKKSVPAWKAASSEFRAAILSAKEQKKDEPKNGAIAKNGALGAIAVLLVMAGAE